MPTSPRAIAEAASPQRSAWRGAAIFALVVAAYVLAGRLGLLLASLHDNVSPVWPATGVGIAAVARLGRRGWFAVWLGAFVVNAMTDVALAAAAAIGIGNAFEAGVGAWLLARGRTRLAGLDAFAEPAAMLLAAVAAPLPSAGIGVATLLASGSCPASVAGGIALTWWSGDALGALLVTPLLLDLLAVRWGRPRAGTLGRFAVVALLATVLCRLVFADPETMRWQFVAFLPLLLAAAWFGRLGAMSVAALVTWYAVQAASQASLGVALNGSLLHLELLLAAVVVTALFLGDLIRRAASPWPVAVLVTGWVLSGYLFGFLQDALVGSDRLRLDRIVAESEAAIGERMRTYTEALRCAVGLFAAVERVDYASWGRFAESLDLVTRYPGINGIGVIWPVAHGDLEAFVAARRADGQPTFPPHPVPNVTPPPVAAGDPEHLLITFIRPEEPNRAAIGLDVGTERNRRTAALLARDTGMPRITDRIVLVQDGKRGPGFLLYVPVYRGGVTPATTAERRREFVCWIYAPFITERFLSGVLGNDREVEVQLFGGAEPAAAEVLWTSDGAAARPFGDYERLTHMALAGVDFTIAWRRSARFAAADDTAVLLAGSGLALVSLLLAGLVLSLHSLRDRAERLAQERTQELVLANYHLAREAAERQRAELEAVAARSAAEQANHAKSEFLATMSHEIRTPMNSVLGFADLLAASALGEEQAGWVGYIQASGRTLLTLIDDVLDFSKIEAGKLELEAAPFDVVAGARAVLGALGKPAADRGLRLELELGVPPPGLILGDAVRFAQVLTNLIANALKFTAAGEVRLTLGYVALGDRTGALRVVVADTGIGIPEDKLGLLFREFQQVDSSTTRRFGGTGLGLSICRRLVTLMGGEITVQSRVGEGSRFSFEVPVRLAEPQAAGGDGVAVAAASNLASVAGAAHARVLVVDDVRSNQVLLQTMLGRHGCVVDVADDGAVAVAMCTKQRYDLVLMDCQMPVLDGFAATSTIRALERDRGGGAGDRVTILAVTANALEGDRQRCLAAGMDDYLSKPVRAAALREKLERWLGGGRASGSP